MIYKLTWTKPIIKLTKDLVELSLMINLKFSEISKMISEKSQFKQAQNDRELVIKTIELLRRESLRMKTIDLPLLIY